ncbi:hypothetical protein TYRP_020795 [Tyrophagus putrescentiae]|nr:hypothetical protein TYRP_020795 [Tyrophagus putrescentiae]
MMVGILIWDPKPKGPVQEKKDVIESVFMHDPVGTLLRRIIDKAIRNNKPMFPIGFLFRADINENLLVITVGRRCHIIEKVEKLNKTSSPRFHSECHDYTNVPDGNIVLARFQLFISSVQCVSSGRSTEFAERRMQIEVSSELFAKDESGRVILPFGLPSQLPIRVVNDPQQPDFPLVRFNVRQLKPEFSEQELVKIGEALFRNYKNNPLKNPFQLGFLICSDRYGGLLNVEVRTRASLKHYITNNVNYEFFRRDDFNLIRAENTQFCTENLFCVLKNRGSCDFGVVPFDERPLQLQVMVELLRGNVRPPCGPPARNVLYLASGRPVHLPDPCVIAHNEDFPGAISVKLSSQVYKANQSNSSGNPIQDPTPLLKDTARFTRSSPLAELELLE